MKEIFFNLLFILFVLGVSSGFAAEQESQTPMPSPYFIDEVHCEGIYVDNIQANWLLTQEQVEAARKVEKQNNCESIFSLYGIKKFMWLSPEDLERTSTLMKYSDTFEEVDLSIKKSELKNHVHLFLKVKPVRRLVNTISNQLKVYGGRGNSSGRIYDQIEGELLDRESLPLSYTRSAFLYEGTYASSPITLSPTANLSQKDTDKFNSKSFQRAELSWKKETALSSIISYDYGAHLAGYSSFASPSNSGIKLWLDGDLFFKNPWNASIGSTWIGPSIIVSDQVLPGFSTRYSLGKETTNRLLLTASFSHSFKNNSIFAFGGSGQYYLAEAKSFLIAGADFRYVRNAYLPQDFYPLTNSYKSDLHVGLSRYIQNKHQVTAVVGREILEATKSYDYSAISDYIALRYKLLDNTVNLNLGVGYYFQRTY